MIVSKFCMGDVISPGPGVISTEDLKVSFKFLVYSFGFSIRLRVVGGGEGKVIF